MGQCFYFTTLVLSVSCQLIPLCHSFEWDEQSSSLQNVRSIFTSLSEEAHSCLVSTFGEKRVDLSIKLLQNGVKWLSDAMASALNVVIQYVTEILESAGFDAKLPFQKVTPEGVIFVAKWALLVVVAYWIISFIVRLVVGAVRQTLWLLKVTFAIGMFGHWSFCRNHSDKTSRPGVCLCSVRNRYNICKARCAPQRQNQDAGETTKRDGEKQNGMMEKSTLDPE